MPRLTIGLAATKMILAGGEAHAFPEGGALYVWFHGQRSAIPIDDGEVEQEDVENFLRVARYLSRGVLTRASDLPTLEG